MVRKPSKAVNSVSKHSPQSKTKPAKASKSHNGLIPPSKILTHTLPPSNWPSTIPYLAQNHLPPSLTPAHLTLLSPSDPSPDSLAIPRLAAYAPSHNPLVQIRQITTPTHPAFRQHGLFAARFVPAGTYIVDYTGLVHACPQESCATSDYDLAFLERDAGLAIDGAGMGNEGRFVNDWHGIRTAGPNAMFEEYFVRVKVKGKECWEARMGIWATPASAASSASGLGIEKGDEICVGYGKGWWRARRGVMELLETEDRGRDEVTAVESMEKLVDQT